MKIFIVGSGKLANAILTSNLSLQSCEILKWESQYQPLNEKAIIVHAGSGRQLKECFEFCTRTKSVFIELSTGLETEKMEPDFPLIICPNTSILLLKTLNIIKVNGKYFENYAISITESHQSTKKTEPGTAYAFANSLKFPLDQIVSIRDSEIQLNKIGIPKEYLDKHAYHKIVIKDGNDEVTIETKVLGHDSYANGVKTIIETVLKYSLENKKYTILDLIDNNML
ncbi:MAG: dihydrodipicolinate reductase C-terminal domain-containing protein [Bacteroidota bacterium]|nr:dihydrodipicolinate reductase C-terminal domain-containing protein [Bacteroidota bacterium]